MPKGVYLGFDFGTKHIGIAVGQTLTQTAQALTSLKAEKGIPKWDEIQTLINTWKPEGLVVGLPLNMDGTEQPLTRQARKFTEQLKEHFHLPVHSMDERLSTVEARSHLFETGGFKALTKSAIDSLSAKLILENWLSRFANSSSE